MMQLRTDDLAMRGIRILDPRCGRRQEEINLGTVTLWAKAETNSPGLALAQ